MPELANAKAALAEREAAIVADLGGDDAVGVLARDPVADYLLEVAARTSPFGTQEFADPATLQEVENHVVSLRSESTGSLAALRDHLMALIAAGANALGIANPSNGDITDR